jgi:hypothetical protein
MTSLIDLRRDKALRDAALGLFKADMAQVRQDISDRGVGARLADRMGEGAVDMMDDALELAENNRGKLGAAVVGLILWFARGPIMDRLSAVLGDEEHDEDADHYDQRYDNYYDEGPQ